MAEENNQAEGGLFASAWSMGAAAWNYASQTVSRCVICYIDDYFTHFYVYLSD
jgi:hypothetical protein